MEKKKYRLSDLAPTEWVIEKNIKTDGGHKLYFTGDRKFLFKPFSDMSQFICVLKAAQVGLSTIKIVKMFFVAEKFGLSFIYTFPTSDLMQKYVKGKVNPLIDANPDSLKALITDTDNIFQKRIGFSNIIFSGAEKESQAIAFSSDCNVHDEIDSSNQKIIAQFPARMQASKYRWNWVFSHPSLPGIGVHGYWERSDQKHWFIKCPNPKCAKEHYMKYPQSIDMKKQVYICRHCKAELSDEDRAKGRWINKYKKSEERPFSGYWIPLFIAPWVSAKEIIKASKGDQYYFYTRVLALPYSTGKDKITIQQVLANLTPEVNKREGRIVIGVDTGVTIWYVMGNKDGIFHYGSCDDYDVLERYMDRFKNAIIIADQGGDLIGIRKLRKKYPGRVFLCHYRKNRKTLQLISWGKHDEDGNVVADRNRVIQIAVEELQERRVPIYGSEEDWYDFAVHWSHIYRLGEENSDGVMEYKWMRSDADHLVHAYCYFRIGISRFAGTGSIFSPVGNIQPLQNSYELNMDGTVSVDHRKLMKNFYEEEDDWRDH